MKKKSFFALATFSFAFLAQSMHAQVVYTPSGIVGTSTNTNVGIGSGNNAPADLLHINGGRLRISNTTTGSTLILSSSSTVQELASSNMFQVASAAGVNFRTGGNTSSRMYIDLAGRVGLGTTVPAEQFQLYSGKLRVGDMTNFLNISNNTTYQEIASTGNLTFKAALNGMSFMTNNAARMFISHGGYVGINTTSPSDQLSINNVGVANGPLTITSDKADYTYGFLYKYTGTASLHKAIAINNAAGVDMFVVHSNGATVIGNVSNVAGLSDPGNSRYKLYVEKGILTERVKVALQGTSDWSDFVFDKKYKLSSLDEVESYIKKNNHLPNVPSADEVAKNGIDLGQMDATLLRQIEELWLHVIELEKENQELKKQINH